MIRSNEIFSYSERKRRGASLVGLVRLVPLVPYEFYQVEIKFKPFKWIQFWKTRKHSILFRFKLSSNLSPFYYFILDLANSESLAPRGWENTQKCQKTCSTGIFELLYWSFKMTSWPFQIFYTSGKMLLDLIFLACLILAKAVLRLTNRSWFSDRRIFRSLYFLIVKELPSRLPLKPR